MVGLRPGRAGNPRGEVRVTGQDRNRVGDVEVAHGTVTVLLILHGRWPGSVQLEPDDADALADRLRDQAAHVRRLRAHDADQ